MTDQSEWYQRGRAFGRYLRHHETAARLSLWVPLTAAAAHVAAFTITVVVFAQRPWLWRTEDLAAYLVVVTALGVAKGVAVALEE
jgi:hypothetical protein